jgi:hypothetical protein
VPQETWKNIRYTYESTDRTVKEEELGTFTQYPLRLAWAITIHKSQGLTFEKAIIDAGRAFEAGQVYVALSRCTCLEGMVLLSPVTQGIVMTHERIAQFGRRDRPISHLEEIARTSKREYLRVQILQTFQYAELVKKVIQMQQTFAGFKDMFNASAGDWLSTLYILSEELQQFSKTFLHPLNLLQEKAEDFEKDEELNAFLSEKSPLLMEILQDKIWVHWRRLPGMQSGHSRKSADAFFELVEETGDLLKQRILQVSRLKDGFKVDVFFGRRSVFQPVAAHPSAPPKIESGKKSYSIQQNEAGVSEGKGPYPEFKLVQLLKELTESLAEADDIPGYMVANKATVKELGTYLPLDLEELRHIKGFANLKVEKYGSAYIALISDYCKKYHLESRIKEKILLEEAVAKEKPKSTGMSKPGATKEFSAQLWKEGKSIDEIATERTLARGTIEGHLAHALEAGLIELDDKLLPENRRKIIEDSIDPNWEEVTVATIREKLGEAFGYGEIRLALAFRNRKQQESAIVSTG